MKKTITEVIQHLEQFKMKEAYDAVEKAGIEAKKPSIRARVYEAVDNGVLKKIAKGVYRNNDCLLVQGDGRDLSFIADGSIDAIITDHPYEDPKANNGGDRHFATYDCFKYTQKDFDEKARVLKDGCFLVEFLPEESSTNFDYVYQIKKMAEAAGFKYYAQVPWKKGTFISNCGRKSKNTENVMIFSKGDARAMRPDAKKDKAEPGVKHYMKGAAGMLPTVFDYQKPAKKEMIHQAEKPVELLEAILDYVTMEGETVLDQFAGSGVLGEAALNKKRRCILIELADEFVAKICNRLKLSKEDLLLV
jgi:site-specific DNA-methyltransferase (adenine-specific)